MLDWLPDGWRNWELTWGVGLAAAVGVIAGIVASTAAGVAVLLRLPADYLRARPRLGFPGSRHPVFRWAVKIAKNVLGILLIPVGVLLALPGVPGPGFLVILVGVILVDFPGKRRLERWLIGRPRVLRAINRLWARFDRLPLESPEMTPGDASSAGEGGSGMSRSGPQPPTLASRLIGLVRRAGGVYAAGLAVAVAALTGFASVAEDALDGDVRATDAAVLRDLQAHRSPTRDALAEVLTNLGDVAGTTVMGALGVLFFLRVRRPVDAAGLLLVLLGGLALAIALKHSFRLPRPDLYPWLPPEEGYSFPSGHALMGVCLYGYLAAVLVLAQPRRVWRWAVAAGLVGIAAGIGRSRVYLGVHWLSDVIAGSLVSVFWVVCCLLARQSFLARTAGT